MGKTLNRLAHFVTQIIFSAITPALLVPTIAERSITWRLIAFCFGRSYGNRYQSIIDSFGGRYGAAMAEGLKGAQKAMGKKRPIIIDCGTGTGFVTKKAAKVFPNATFVACDILHGMLLQAKRDSADIGTDLFHLQADTFFLPLRDGSVDLLLAQNTIPCFSEFARVCRPGGMILYSDTSSGWIADLAERLVKRNKIFNKVECRRVDLGFYMLVQ
jgi:SAM-dependent methyltransferase